MDNYQAVENNYDDIDRQVNEAHKKRQQKQQNVKIDEDYLDEVINANVINKRVIGKVMLKYCGNEGAEHDERTRSLRKLLQAVIDFIQVNPKIKWNNAEVTVYDSEDNSFRIFSGEGKHQYVVTDDGKGGIEIVNTANKVYKNKPEQQTQPTKEHSHTWNKREDRSSNRTTGGYHPYRQSGDPHYQHYHGTNEKDGWTKCTIS